MFYLLIILYGLLNCYLVETNDGYKEPTIFLAIFARNKETSLPYFLTLLQDQDYPKNRIKLWIKTDHNVDKTVEIIETWISNVTNLYHSVNLTTDDGNHFKFDDDKGPTSWSLKRFKHLIELKEKALNVARENWADFIFVSI